MNANFDKIQDQPCLTLSFAQVAAVRYALLIGLDSYGEIERLRDHPAMSHQAVADGLRPIHPTGSNETIGDFATALRYIEI